jgi:hypothetical protein
MQPRPIAAAQSGFTSAAFWQRLFYRWFVEYNPLYLLSAALVLAGCFLWSRGLVHEESLAGPLGIALVAEVYAASLVGGAALLTRIGHRRPAVMLALIFVLYQWDSTLHTETCAYLGSVGALATALWFALFLGKLRALTWALRVRFDRRVVAAALVGAAGLALGPRLLPALGGRGAGAMLGVWVFALGTLYRPGGIASVAELDAWGRTVLRRATRAAWLMSGGLIGLHVLMWWKDHDLSLAAALLAVPLVAVQRVRSEARTWATLVGTLAVAAIALPGAFSVTALLVAAALCLRALAPAFAAAPEAPRPHAATPAPDPYRAGDASAWATEPPVVLVDGALVEGAVVGAAERTRSFGGALIAIYLAAWTAGWTGSAWPHHMLALDLALTFAVMAFTWRTGARAILVPLVASYGHYALAAHLIPAPRTTAGWGETIVGVGFALLAASLLASYRLRTYDPRAPTFATPATGARD